MLMLIMLIWLARSDFPGYSLEFPTVRTKIGAQRAMVTILRRRSTITILSIPMLISPFPWLTVLRITKILCYAQRSDEWIPQLVCCRRPYPSLSDLQGPQDHFREVRRAKCTRPCPKSSPRCNQSSWGSSDHTIPVEVCVAAYLCMPQPPTECHSLSESLHFWKYAHHSHEKWIISSSKNVQKLQIECSASHPTCIILEFCDSPSLHLDQTKRLRYPDPTLAA